MRVAGRAISCDTETADGLGVRRPRRSRRNTKNSLCKLETDWRFISAMLSCGAHGDDPHVVAMGNSDGICFVCARDAALSFDIAPVVPLCFALATTRDRRFPIGVAFAWMVLTIVLAGFVAMRLPISTATGLLIQVTAQKLVFVSIAATLLYESLQAGRVASGTRS